MNNRLQKVADSHSWIPSYQASFRKHRNPVEHLIRLQQSAHSALRKKQLLLVAFLDIKQAYDTVSRPILLQLLRSLGVGGLMLAYITAFLSNRTSAVRYRSSSCEAIQFTYGVPQGSPISPLLYSIYSASAIAKAGSLKAQAADDLAVWATGPNLKTAARRLQKKLSPVFQWGLQHRQTFHPDKCKVLTITRKRAIPNPQVRFGSFYLKPVNSAKYLGVVFDRSLSWRQHVKHIRTKVQPRVVKLCRLSHSSRGSPEHVLKLLYCQSIRPVLEYASEVWGDCSETSARRLSSIQHKCLARSLGVNRLSHLHETAIEAGIPPLSIRRKIQLLRFWRRILIHPCPLTSFLQNIPRSLRLREKRRASFLERLHQCGRQLNVDLSQANLLTNADLNTLQNRLWDNSHPRQNNPDSRSIQYALIQPTIDVKLPKSHSKRFVLALWHGLRLGSAPLNAFLSSINCAPSSMCSCNTGIETVPHYLLRCPFHNRHRTKLFRSVRRIIGPRPVISTRILLGNPLKLSPKHIASIYNSVSRFICRSRRFKRRRSNRRRR